MARTHSMSAKSVHPWGVGGHRIGIGLATIHSHLTTTRLDMELIARLYVAVDVTLSRND
jgi:hypothetical protein